MARPITELHNIMPIGNVPSVLEHGLLSYEGAALLKHHSVAMPHIQDKRDQVQIPGGLKLHQYANLYFDARNPMMFVRKDQHANLCVLRVSPNVLRLDGVVVTDQNAASPYVRFLSPAQMGLIRFDWVFLEDWRHSDRITYFRQRSAKCAEVLVPQYISAEFLVGAYASCDAASRAMIAAGWKLPIEVNTHIFFQEAQK